MHTQQLIRSIVLLSVLSSISGFVPSPPLRAVSTNVFINPNLAPKTSIQTLLMAKRDSSRSGTKRERLDKLAELEDQRIATDKGFVLKAAGGFVGFCVILLIAAFSSGVFDDLIVNGPY